MGEMAGMKRDDLNAPVLYLANFGIQSGAILTAFLLINNWIMVTFMVSFATLTKVSVTGDEPVRRHHALFGHTAASRLVLTTIWIRNLLLSLSLRTIRGAVSPEITVALFALPSTCVRSGM